MDLRRLPELFCGFQREKQRGPTLYPVACAPQAWASATPFTLLEAALGLEFDAQRGEIRLRNPRLPAFLNEVMLRDLQLGRFKRRSPGPPSRRRRVAGSLAHARPDSGVDRARALRAALIAHQSRTLTAIPVGKRGSPKLMCGCRPGVRVQLMPFDRDFGRPYARKISVCVPCHRCRSIRGCRLGSDDTASPPATPPPAQEQKAAPRPRRKRPRRKRPRRRPRSPSSARRMRMACSAAMSAARRMRIWGRSST